MFPFLATPDFVESLKNLDQKVQEIVKAKLQHLSTSENPPLFSKRLKGCKNIFRFRAADYRIVFQLEKQKIILLVVKHRKEIYEGL